MTRRISSALAALAGGSIALSALAGANTPAEIVVAEGDAVGDGVVTSVNAPFTDSTGKVGLVGIIELPDESTDRFVWYDTGPVFFGSDVVTNVLTGGEGTMDVTDTGDFHYSPSVDGNDGSWSATGPVLVETDEAPGFPGQFISFASRPRVTPGGDFYVVSGVTDTKGGSTNNRVFYRVNLGKNTFDPVYVAGSTVIDGVPVSTGSGVDFDYNFSDDGGFLINVLDLDTGNTDTDFVVVLNGQKVLQEGDDAGNGETFDNIDQVDVNNAGDWIVTGDTDGDGNFDEYIALNGAIILRQGDLVDGVNLSGSVNAVSLNDDGVLAHIWGSGDEERLYTTDTATNETSVILAVNDVIEVQTDGTTAYTVLDFNASGVIGPGLDFQEDGFIHVEVDLEPVGGGEEFEAIIRLDLGGGGPLCPGDLNGDFVVNSEDLNILLGAFGSTADGDLDDDGDTDSTDLNILLGNFGNACL